MWQPRSFCASWRCSSQIRRQPAPKRVPPGPGDYVVWADLKGFKLPDGRHLHAGPDVQVHIDGDERSDIGLHLTW